MEFALTIEISEDVSEKWKVIVNFSDNLEKYFKDKNYGNAIKKILVGIICVHPKFDFFYKVRRGRHEKADQYFCYDIKIDHGKFKVMDESGIKKMLAESLLSSLEILKKRVIKDFELQNFKKDLEIFLRPYM